jgi:hypothetical protein
MRVLACVLAAGCPQAAWYGSLDVLQNGQLHGPISHLGYYGHHDWGPAWRA